MVLISTSSVWRQWADRSVRACTRTAALRAFFPISPVTQSDDVDRRIPALISDLSNASYLPEVTLGRWPEVLADLVNARQDAARA